MTYKFLAREHLSSRGENSVLISAKELVLFSSKSGDLLLMYFKIVFDSTKMTAV